MPRSPLETLTERLKVLAHPARLRLLSLLRDGELCVCQVSEALGLPASTASEHLGALKRADLVLERREGRWVHYALSPEPETASLLEALWPDLDADGQAARDAEAARRVREIPLPVVCAARRA